MNYVFWARRNSDVDHMVPVIYTILKNGINPKNIKYYDYWLHRSLHGIDIRRDPRIMFLRRHGVVFKQSKICSVLFLINSFLLSFSSKIIIVHIIKFFWGKLYHHLITIIYTNKIKGLSKKYEKNAIFIIDHGSSTPYQLVAKYAKKHHIKTFAVPHGIYMHRGAKDIKHHKIIFHEKENMKFFDLIAIPNQIYKLFHHSTSKNTIVLGTPRFDMEWIRILKNIYSSPNQLRDENNLNVLFFAEKKGMNFKNEFIPWFDMNQVLKIIDFLSSDPSINLIIKPHPSLRGRKLDPYRRKNVILIDEKKKFSSFQLVKIADVVVSISTSALMDALILQKRVLIPTYASSFKLLISEYDNNCIAETFEEFIEKMESYKKTFMIQKNPGYNKLVDDLVGMPGVLPRYAEFVMHETNVLNK